MPEESDCCDIAIVGGGCSGVLTAVQLLRKGFKGRIRMVEPRARLGRGLAYSTSFPEHLLNVPAEKMSAFPDRHSDFADWLRLRQVACPERGYFAPRMLYGEYLEDLLQAETRAEQGRDCRHIRAEVTAVEEIEGGARLTLNEGSPIRARKVVLALGNPLSSPFPGISIPTSGGKWYASPWLDDALKVRLPGERVLLIGTGLTAIDSAMALQNQERGSETWLLSRRGILPQVHAESCAAGVTWDLRTKGSARLLLREVRDRVSAMRENGVCWRVALDLLRPVSNSVWQEMAREERARFMRHLKRYWEPHRHRMAPEVRRRMDQLQSEGRVHVLAGRIRDVAPRGDSLEARIRLRDGGERRLEVDRIVNCSGIEEQYGGQRSRPLIQMLVGSGLAEANDLGIGFRTDGAGALTTCTRGVSSVLFTLGPPRRGEMFETTAVPEIRIQAELLALRLIGSRTE